ncbi:putative uncharacterized protein DDB_G0291608, partial [Saccostrea cucullata]|uniref:putative uncharacterized protein DDB_G0291608 n=1 Tax=Saccostrea cuccullata TaxID=36930 RepID=UPI002ED6448E
MDPRGLGPPARHVSPVTVTYSTVTAAGSQQGPVVPHPQNRGGQPHWSFPPVNLIQQQGQTTAQITSQQQWQQQQFSMGGQNQRLSQNQNEVYMPSQQHNFKPHMIKFSRPAVPQPRNYGGNPFLGIPKANFLPQQGQTTAQQASQQQRQQQQYLMIGKNGLSAPNQYEVYTPFQQQSFNQRKTITSRPALVSDQNYGVQDLMGFHSRNTIQRLEQTTPQPTSHQQQHQQWLQYQQQFTNEQIASHKNDAYMSNQQPHSNQELRTPLVPTTYYLQNNGAPAPWGLHPFIQQGNTTQQPALQQQHPHQQHQYRQQHLMKGQNEQLTPHTPHRNDFSMPYQRPNFDQFITTHSELDQRWDSLDCKTRLHLPPLIRLEGSMGNMCASPAGPVGNMSTSPAIPMGNMSASSSVHIGNMSAFPIRNISASPVDRVGNMSAST